MKLVFLAAFFLNCIIHLAASWRDNRKGRLITKPLLILCLGLYYAAASEGNSEPVLFMALFASWMGDILLMVPGLKWFMLGGTSFFVSHLFFILLYCGGIRAESVNGLVILLAAAGYAAASWVIVRLVREFTPKRLVVPMYLYLAVNSVMNLFSLMRLMSSPGQGSMLAYLGALLFFLSDCALFLVRYHGKKHLIFKRHFTVMLLYLAGEFLITQGILLL